MGLNVYRGFFKKAKKIFYLKKSKITVMTEVDCRVGSVL
jgi:hypothetical protein